MKNQTLQGQFRLWTLLLVVVPSLLIMGIYTVGQIQLAKQVVEKGLSVRALESLTKNKETSAVASEKTENAIAGDLSQRLAKELADQLQKTLGTKVSINYKNGKGDLTIHFYTDDQLNSIYEKINQ